MATIPHLSPPPSLPLPGYGLQLTTGLTSSIGDGADSSCQIGRGGSPSNTLGTHGTETGSPELSAAGRVLAAQGPMGQERRWAEVEMRRREEPDGNTLPLPPSLPLPGYRSPTDHRIDLLHRRWRGMRVAK